MSSVKLAPTRALKVIPSDYCDVPTPNVGYRSDDGSAICPNGNTVQLGENNLFIIEIEPGVYVNLVNPGDIIYFYIPDYIAATVVEVYPTYLIINADILPGLDQSCKFVIYQSSLFPNSGCQIYTTNNEKKDINVLSAGSDVSIDSDFMTFSVINSQVIPFQIKKVFDSGTTLSYGEIIAMW